MSKPEFKPTSLLLGMMPDILSENLLQTVKCVCIHRVGGVGEDQSGREFLVGAQQKHTCRGRSPHSPVHVRDFSPVLEGLKDNEAETPSLSLVPTCRGICPTMGTLLMRHHADGRSPQQINLNESMQVVSRRAVTVAYGEPVHHVMQFDPADPGYLYLMTSHQVRPETPLDMRAFSHSFSHQEHLPFQSPLSASLHFPVEASRLRGSPVSPNGPC